ncbi:MAG: EAL domain-containing protein [Pseudomonadales bacterium]|nr:EAL domain-containing protein [Pseudomonadales bacterium]
MLSSNSRFQFLVFTLASWLACCNVALALDTVELKSNVATVKILANNLKYLEDPDDLLTVDELLTNRNKSFLLAENDTINLGHSASSLWAMFNVKVANEVLKQKTWYLEVSYPLLKRVRIYLVANGQVLQTYHLGYQQQMLGREIPNRFFVQPLSLHPDVEYQIYVNVMRKHGTVQLPLRILGETAFVIDQISNNYVFGIFFGIMAAMIIYNFYLFLSVGGRAYLYYILYIASVTTAFLTTSGYGFLFIWRDFPVVNEYALQIPSTLAAIFGLLFVRHFVKVGAFFQYIDKFISYMVAIGLGLILLRLLTNYFLSESITIYVAFISTVIPVMVWQCWRKGSRSAGFFLLGWALLLVGSTLYTLNLLGILPANELTNNAVFVGAALETLLLSLGLADRINHERREKYAALSEKHEAVVGMKEAQQQLVHRALHSRVTGLPNRSFLRAKLDSIINERGQKPFSIVLISLNNFHEFNKALGHANGDAILNLLTQRMNNFCKSKPYLMPLEAVGSETFYLSGVEGTTFSVLIDEEKVQAVDSFVYNLISEVEQPLVFQGLNLEVDTTASLAKYPDFGTNSDTLIRNINIALEVATNAGEKLTRYSREIDPYSERRISLLGDLRHAIDHDELQIYLQPQVSLATGKVEGAEVLLRWIHPEYGFIPPDEFVALAERTGVIHSLTSWVCNQAFKEKAELQNQGVTLNLSINISARNLQDEAFKDQILELAKEYQIPTSEIILELTETAVMTDPDDALRMMSELHAGGLRLSIDDFGTGYSSLAYIKRLPVDEMKIDRSFVMDMLENKDDQLLVQTMLTMGKNLGLTVVAEGVEDENTLNLLANMGCDVAQGYHISRPMPANQFYPWLKAFNERPASEQTGPAMTTISLVKTQ